MFEAFICLRENCYIISLEKEYGEVVLNDACSRSPFEDYADYNSSISLFLTFLRANFNNVKKIKIGFDWISGVLLSTENQLKDMDSTCRKEKSQIFKFHQNV